MHGAKFSTKISLTGTNSPKENKQKNNNNNNHKKPEQIIDKIRTKCVDVCIWRLVVHMCIGKKVVVGKSRRT